MALETLDSFGRIRRTDAASAPSVEQDIVQAGVVSGGGLTRNSLVQVTIAAGTAWVKLASGLLTRVAWGSTVLAVRVPPGAQSALDQVIVDSAGAVSIQQGALQASADGAGILASRAGADDTGIGAGKLRLADLLTASGPGGLTATNWRDRRPWARGAHYNYFSTSGTDYSTSTGGYVSLDSVNSTPRLEIASGLVEVELDAYVSTANGGQNPIVYVQVTKPDGSSITLAAAGNRPANVPTTVDDWKSRITYRDTVVVPPGSCVFDVRINPFGGSTLTIKRADQYPFNFRVRECTVPSANNNSN